MKKIFNLLLFAVGLNSLSAQTLPTFQAPEPSKVFEFTKYDQIPVGEYTGVPGINIPLHSLKIDDIEVPIGLQYHAGGIRTNEEASNVGLGWNMNFGQISQTINDRDDLLLIQYTKKLLKYQKAVNPVIYEWPMNCFNFSTTACQLLPNGTNCTPEPNFIATLPSVVNSIFIATNGYPLEGQSFCSTRDEDVDNASLDTEPDIFRVNFFGHSLKFLKRFDTPNGTIEILNNKGYKIEMFTDTANSINWKVITPDGNQFIFGKYRQDYNSTNTDGVTPDFMRSGGSSYTNNWSLIKIITNKNKVVDFEYNDFGQTRTSSYSQKLMAISNMVTSDFSPGGIGQITSYANFSDAFLDGAPSTIYPLTTSAMYEKMVYVSKITTPTETVTFQYSDRTDRLNDKKMDKIVIKNLKLAIFKTFNFSYNYFVATETGNMFITPNLPGSPFYNPSILPTHNTQRLKLLSVQEVGTNPYTFVYDVNTLPRKTSTAVDFWGFYNGKTTNTSLVPNPASVGYPAFGNNGNDKSAYIDYTRASVLKEINYPTGGKVAYEYELNEYERASFETVLPNAGNVAGTLTKGNGIRIKSISLYDKGILQRKTNYSYSGGISLVPFEIMKHYSGATARLMATGSPVTFEYYHCTTFSVDEFHNTNFQRPALLGSYNMVGYSEVTMEHTGLSEGKTVYKFANKRDEKSLQQHDYMIAIEMPSLMDINATENGKIISEETYANGNAIPVLKKEYTYQTQKSNIFFGNLIVPFRNRIGFDCAGGGCWSYYKPQHLVGYYAIYDKHSLLSTEKVTESFSSGSKWNISSYSYNANNLLYIMTKKDESGTIIASENTGFYSNATLLSQNWLNLPQQKTIVEDGKSNTMNYSYTVQSSLTVPQSIELLPGGSPAPEYKSKITYDLYDDLGNLLQFHNENGIVTCIVWGYKKSLPIAKIENASYSEFSSLVSNLQNLSDIDSTENLNLGLDALRNVLPNAVVTTYTHIPSIGVSTMTDAKGDRFTYSYDASNRLQYVLDKDNKILSRNEYNYRP